MTAFTQAVGLADVRHFFEDLPQFAEQAAVFAVNDTADKGLPPIRQEMRSQIEFPAGYLEGDRLRVTRRARVGSLEAVIKGRDRATSLARFAAGQTPANTRGRGVRVMVKKGTTRVLQKGFMVDLKNGNRGVAVRLKPGETLRNSDKAVRLDDNVFLLYGPSVDQVFESVADDFAPRLGADMSRHFLRHFTRLTRG
jgi:hypothetical protein